MSQIITRTCGKGNKVSTDCFFRKMILNHTIYITDAQVEAKKFLKNWRIPLIKSSKEEWILKLTPSGKICRKMNSFLVEK